MATTPSHNNRTTRLLRWLVRADHPGTLLTPAEADTFIRRNFRWNYGVMLTDGVTFWLAMSFLAYSTIIPLFVSKLTTSTLAIGLVAMLSQGGWHLPQLLSANLVERLSRRKPVIINLGLFLERLPLWLLLIPVAFAFRWPNLALVLFLLIYAWSQIGAGLVAPAFQDLMARVMPLESRGRFWGSTSALGAGLGLGAAALTAYLLATYPFPVDFLVIFALAATVMTVGWLAIAFAREPALPPREPRQSQGEYLAALPELVRLDTPFRNYLVGAGLMSLAGMGLGFITVAAVRRWDVGDGTVGIYTMVMLVGQAGGNLLFGFLADRRGHLLSLRWSAALYAVAFALAWLAPEESWFFLVFLLLGVATGAQIVSRILIVMEFGEPQRRPTYLGLANTIGGLASMAGPLVGAWLASIDFGLVFAVSAGISVAALMVFVVWVQDPLRLASSA